MAGRQSFLKGCWSDLKAKLLKEEGFEEVYDSSVQLPFPPPKEDKTSE